MKTVIICIKNPDNRPKNWSAMDRNERILFFDKETKKKVEKFKEDVPEIKNLNIFGTTGCIIIEVSEEIEQKLISLGYNVTQNEEVFLID